MDNFIVNLNNISKKYSNFLDSTEIQALRPLSLQIKKKNFYLIAGSNGIGKTTLMNIISGIITPDTGEGTILGIEINNLNKIRNKIGYSPDILPKISHVTVRDFFKTLSELRRVDNAEKYNWIRFIKLFQLKEWIDRPLNWFSSGMLKRISLISSFFHGPELILLDEPLENLDEKAKLILEEILLEYLENGKTIIMTSHIIKDDGFTNLKPILIHMGDLFTN